MATDGKSSFFELTDIRDARKVTIKFGGYALGYKHDQNEKGHPSVKIYKPFYKKLEKQMLDLARHGKTALLVKAFFDAPFEPYAPVRNQMFFILKKVNKALKSKRLPTLTPQVIRKYRKSLKPFKL